MYAMVVMVVMVVLVFMSNHHPVNAQFTGKKN